jgi:aarF domain-containing kinase
VYKARLKANGDTVAIKIQRPKCEEIISLDLYILRWWSGIYTNVFQFLNRDINVQSIIDDFGELIYREIDYVAEGECLARTAGGVKWLFMTWYFVKIAGANYSL